MRRFYQTEWLGIKFQDVIQVSIFKKADVDFYDRFYSVFFSRNKSYDDLPSKYINNKNGVANHLFNFLIDKGSILSIGCGIGYVEYKLNKMLGDVSSRAKIVAVEPSVQVIEWHKTSERVKFIHGFFPKDIGDEEVFDIAYAILVDYSMDNYQYLNLLQNIREYGVREIYFVVSIDNPPLDIIGRLKEGLILLLTMCKVKNCGQFWGYLRTIDEHHELMRVSGFNINARP